MASQPKSVVVQKRFSERDDYTNWESGWTAWLAFPTKPPPGGGVTPLMVPKLLRWVQKQREEFKKYSQGLSCDLNEERIDTMTKKGFDWNMGKVEGNKAQTALRTLTVPFGDRPDFRPRSQQKNPSANESEAQSEAALLAKTSPTSNPTPDPNRTKTPVPEPKLNSIISNATQTKAGESDLRLDDNVAQHPSAMLAELSSTKVVNQDDSSAVAVAAALASETSPSVSATQTVAALAIAAAPEPEFLVANGAMSGGEGSRSDAGIQDLGTVVALGSKESEGQIFDGNHSAGFSAALSELTQSIGGLGSHVVAAATNVAEPVMADVEEEDAKPAARTTRSTRRLPVTSTSGDVEEDATETQALDHEKGGDSDDDSEDDGFFQSPAAAGDSGEKEQQRSTYTVVKTCEKTGKKEIRNYEIRSLSRLIPEEKEEEVRSQVREEFADLMKCEESLVANKRSGVDFQTAKSNFAWEENFFEFLVFRKVYGHSIVPKCFVENPALGRWTVRNRRWWRIKDKRLTKSRLERLTAANFVWEAKKDPSFWAIQAKTLQAEDKWESRFQMMMEYKATHGDCLVPKEYQPNMILARWVGEQRKQMKAKREGRKSTLSDEREGRLKEAGFVFNTRTREHLRKNVLQRFQDRWMECFERLVKFKEKYGHAAVPRRWKEDSDLASWAMRQRSHGKKFLKGQPSYLSKERYDLLRSIDFVFYMDRTLYPMPGIRAYNRSYGEGESAKSEEGKVGDLSHLAQEIRQGDQSKRTQTSNDELDIGALGVDLKPPPLDVAQHVDELFASATSPDVSGQVAEAIASSGQKVTQIIALEEPGENMLQSPIADPNGDFLGSLYSTEYNMEQPSLTESGNPTAEEGKQRPAAKEHQKQTSIDIKASSTLKNSPNEGATVQSSDEAFDGIVEADPPTILVDSVEMADESATADSTKQPPNVSSPKKFGRKQLPLRTTSRKRTPTKRYNERNTRTTAQTPSSSPSQKSSEKNEATAEEKVVSPAHAGDSGSEKVGTRRSARSAERKKEAKSDKATAQNPAKKGKRASSTSAVDTADKSASSRTAVLMPTRKSKRISAKDEAAGKRRSVLGCNPESSIETKKVSASERQKGDELLVPRGVSTTKNAEKGRNEAESSATRDDKVEETGKKIEASSEVSAPDNSNEGILTNDRARESAAVRAFNKEAPRSTGNSTTTDTTTTEETELLNKVTEVTDTKAEGKEETLRRTNEQRLNKDKALQHMEASMSEDTSSETRNHKKQGTLSETKTVDELTSEEQMEFQHTAMSKRNPTEMIAKLEKETRDSLVHDDEKMEGKQLSERTAADTELTAIHQGAQPSNQVKDSTVTPFDNTLDNTQSVNNNPTDGTQAIEGSVLKHDEKQAQDQRVSCKQKTTTIMQASITILAPNEEELKNISSKTEVKRRRHKDMSENPPNRLEQTKLQMRMEAEQKPGELKLLQSNERTGQADNQLSASSASARDDEGKVASKETAGEKRAGTTQPELNPMQSLARAKSSEDWLKGTEVSVPEENVQETKVRAMKNARKSRTSTASLGEAETSTDVARQDEKVDGYIRDKNTRDAVSMKTAIYRSKSEDDSNAEQTLDKTSNANDSPANKDNTEKIELRKTKQAEARIQSEPATAPFAMIPPTQGRHDPLGAASAAKLKKQLQNFPQDTEDEAPPAPQSFKVSDIDGHVSMKAKATDLDSELTGSDERKLSATKSKQGYSGSVFNNRSGKAPLSSSKEYSLDERGENFVDAEGGRKDGAKELDHTKLEEGRKAIEVADVEPADSSGRPEEFPDDKKGRALTKTQIGVEVDIAESSKQHSQYRTRSSSVKKVVDMQSEAVSPTAKSGIGKRGSTVASRNSQRRTRSSKKEKIMARESRERQAVSLVADEQPLNLEKWSSSGSEEVIPDQEQPPSSSNQQDSSVTLLPTESKVARSVSRTGDEISLVPDTGGEGMASSLQNNGEVVESKIGNNVTDSVETQDTNRRLRPSRRSTRGKVAVAAEVADQTTTDSSHRTSRRRLTRSVSGVSEENQRPENDNHDTRKSVTTRSSRRASEETSEVVDSPKSEGPPRKRLRSARFAQNDVMKSTDEKADGQSIDKASGKDDDKNGPRKRTRSTELSESNEQEFGGMSSNLASANADQQDTEEMMARKRSKLSALRSIELNNDGRSVDGEGEMNVSEETAKGVAEKLPDAVVGLREKRVEELVTIARLRGKLGVQNQNAKPQSSDNATIGSRPPKDEPNDHSFVDESVVVSELPRIRKSPIKQPLDSSQSSVRIGDESTDRNVTSSIRTALGTLAAPDPTDKKSRTSERRKCRRTSKGQEMNHTPDHSTSGIESSSVLPDSDEEMNQSTQFSTRNADQCRKGTEGQEKCYSALQANDGADSLKMPDYHDPSSSKLDEKRASETQMDTSNQSSSTKASDKIAEKLDLGNEKPEAGKEKNSHASDSNTQKLVVESRKAEVEKGKESFLPDAGDEKAPKMDVVNQKAEAEKEKESSAPEASGKTVEKLHDGNPKTKLGKENKSSDKANEGDKGSQEAGVARDKTKQVSVAENAEEQKPEALSQYTEDTLAIAEDMLKLKTVRWACDKCGANNHDTYLGYLAHEADCIGLSGICLSIESVL